MICKDSEKIVAVNEKYKTEANGLINMCDSYMVGSMQGDSGGVSDYEFH